MKKFEITLAAINLTYIEGKAMRQFSEKHADMQAIDVWQSGSRTAVNNCYDIVRVFEAETGYNNSFVCREIDGEVYLIFVPKAGFEQPTFDQMYDAIFPYLSEIGATGQLEYIPFDVIL